MNCCVNDGPPLVRHSLSPGFRLAIEGWAFQRFSGSSETVKAVSDGVTVSTGLKACVIETEANLMA